jgi:hypothetical protein
LLKTDDSLSKYNRVYLLNFFNRLHRKTEFKRLLVDDFLLRRDPVVTKRAIRIAFNPNKDSNSKVKPDFFKDITPSSSTLGK